MSGLGQKSQGTEQGNPSSWDILVDLLGSPRAGFRQIYEARPVGWALLILFMPTILPIILSVLTGQTRATPTIPLVIPLQSLMLFVFLSTLLFLSMFVYVWVLQFMSKWIGDTGESYEGLLCVVAFSYLWPWALGVLLSTQLSGVFLGVGGIVLLLWSLALQILGVSETQGLSTELAVVAVIGALLSVFMVFVFINWLTGAHVTIGLL